MNSEFIDSCLSFRCKADLKGSERQKMASEISGLLPKDIQDLVLKSKILVVGAGGVGCELLKNLVLTGYKDIHIVRDKFIVN